MIKSRAIPSLDGLRAISIALVIIGHISQNYYELYKESLTRIGSILQVSLVVGHLGVMVFFVISGFLITTLLLREERIDLFKFYLRRTLRIFPPYYAYLIVLVVLTAIGIARVPTENLVRAFTYTTDYSYAYTDDSWYIAHTWSLSVEEQFYLIFPSLLLLMGRRKMILVVCLAIVGSALARLCYVLHDPTTSPLFFSFEAVCDSLAFGCLLAKSRDWLHRRALYLTLLRSRLFFLVPVGVFLLDWLSRFPGHYSKPIYVLFAISFMNLGVTLVIDRMVTYPEGVFGKFLNLPPMVFIGTISYSLYLWQQPFFAPGLDLPIIVKPVLIFATALLFFYLVEKPSFTLRSYMERRLLQRGGQ